MSVFDIFKELEEKKEKTVLSPIDFIIVCLGNPGDKYETTRHNVGFMCADYICQKNACKASKLKYKALYSEIIIDGRRGLIMKPQTFMNNSGEAVQEAAAFYKIPPASVIVICDDINLDPGKMRIKRKGSDGGHNGLKSIIYLMQSDAFPRIKVGVGKKPHPDYDLADFVLSSFSKDDFEALKTVFEPVYQSVRLILGGKIDEAMCKYNS